MCCLSKQFGKCHSLDNNVAGAAHSLGGAWYALTSHVVSVHMHVELQVTTVHGTWQRWEILVSHCWQTRYYKLNLDYISTCACVVGPAI